MQNLWSLFAAAALAMSACTHTTSEENKEKEPSAFEKLQQNAEKEGKKIHEKTAAYTNACKDEIEKFCKLDKSEPVKTHACLKSNKDKAGPKCRDAIEAAIKAKVF